MGIGVFHLELKIASGQSLEKAVRS